MKRTSFVVSEKNVEPLFAKYRSFRTPVVVTDPVGIVSYTFAQHGNCLTIKAKSAWDMNATQAKAILENAVGFKLLPREKTMTNRQWALARAKELLGDAAVVRFSPKEKEPKWRYAIYESREKAFGTGRNHLGVCSSGHGSDWDNALKVAILAKTGWFFNNEVEP